MSLTQASAPKETTYNRSYVYNLLGIDPQRLESLMSELGITFHTPEGGSEPALTILEVKQLHEALLAQKRPQKSAKPPSTAKNTATPAETTQTTLLKQNTHAEAPSMTPLPITASVSQVEPQRANPPVGFKPTPAMPQAPGSVALETSQYSAVSSQRPNPLSRTELSSIVDAVSNAKRDILNDLSQLLDDKLAGLDELVVELIRSKSENDSLKEELRRMEENCDNYKAELSKYKETGFGFYRKVR